MALPSVRNTPSSRLTNPLVAIARWACSQPSLVACLFYAVLTLTLFGNVLLSANRVLSCKGTDIWKGELAGRIVGHAELRHLHLPLWNPYMFSGMPFFTQSQVPFLYPLEWLGTFLSVNRAINVTLALHTFLAGWFLFLWVRSRGLTFMASLMAGVMFMFSGPFYLHIYGGQINNVTTMTWAPLLFLAIDLIIVEGAYRRGVLLGVFALSMQLYAGQPQYTFFSLIGLLLYTALRLARTDNRGRKFAACAIACAWALAISAVQFIPAFIQAGESIRSGSGASFGFAQTFSLPPANLLTGGIPGLMGDRHSFFYFGRWYMWESSLFVGITGVALAFYGAFCGLAPGRRTAVVMVGFLLLLALGGYTPIFSFLYYHVPGFRMLRGMSKFAFLAVMFICLLAAMGLDAIMKGRSRAIAAIASAGGCAAILLVAAWGVTESGGHGTAGAWGNYIHDLTVSGETCISLADADDPAYIMDAARCTAKELAMAGLLLAVTAMLFRYAMRDRRWGIAIAGLAAAECFLFAVSYRPSFDVRDMLSPQFAADVMRKAGDDRVIINENPNVVTAMGTSNITGYDSFQMRRYAEFLTFTQGRNPADFDAIMSYKPVQPVPLLRLLRLRWIDPGGHQSLVRVSGPPPLPHVLLVDKYVVKTGREDIFAAMSSPGFDPAQTVILESDPGIKPETGSGNAGSVSITHQDTDYLDIEADLKRPAILLVTDPYSQYWTVSEYTSNFQREFRVYPADYTLRAIPMLAGQHTLRLQYIAPAWEESEGLTCLGILAWLLYLASPLWNRRKRLQSAEALS